MNTQTEIQSFLAYKTEKSSQNNGQNLKTGNDNAPSSRAFGGRRHGATTKVCPKGILLFGGHDLECYSMALHMIAVALCVRDTSLGRDGQDL